MVVIVGRQHTFFFFKFCVSEAGGGDILWVQFASFQLFFRNQKETSLWLVSERSLHVPSQTCSRVRAPRFLEFTGWKKSQQTTAVTGDISFKSLECRSPLRLQTCQDKTFWDTVKWFGLQVLHSVLLRLFSAGQQPPDDFHVVGAQANLLVPRNITLLCTVSFAF